MPEIRQELVTCISACIIIIIAYKDRVHFWLQRIKFTDNVEKTKTPGCCIAKCLLCLFRLFCKGIHAVFVAYPQVVFVCYEL